MTPKLTTRQRVFVEAYLACWNATEAAKKAGYSDKTAYSQGPRLLKDVEVAKALQERIDDLKATTDEVLLRLAAHSRGTMDDFLDNFGQVDVALARKRGQMHLIKKVRQRTTTVLNSKSGEEVETHDIELELYDAQAATVQLAKLLGMYPDARIHLLTWQDKVIDLLVSGETTPQDVIEEFGDDIATELFRRARLPGSTGSEAPAEIAAPADSD